MKLTVGALGIGLLVAATTALDLSDETVDERSTIELDDGVDPHTSPLTDDEAEELRAAADPDRLRCEPRGCELWRIALQGHLGGVAALDERTVAVMDRANGLGAEADSEGSPADTRILGVDVADGTALWERPMTDLVGEDTRDQFGGGLSMLAEAPGGAVLAEGRTVIALTADGETRWRWAASDDGSAWLNQVVGTDDTVLVIQETADAGTSSRTSVTALDPDDGQMLWEVDGHRAAYLDDDLLVTIEDDTLRSRDPATGQVRWELEAHAEAIMRPAGPWVVVEHPDATQVVDGQDGSVATDLDGVPVGPVLYHEERLLAALASERPHDSEGQATPMELEVVALDQDGGTVWSTALDEVTADPPCCSLDVDEDAAVLRTSTSEHRLDLETGELVTLVTLEDRDQSTSDDSSTPGMTSWQLDDDVRLEQHTEHHATVRSPAGDMDIHGEISGLLIVSELDLLLLGGDGDAMALSTD